MTPGSGGRRERAVSYDDRTEDDPADFAVAAYREDAVWQVVVLAPHAVEDLSRLLAALRQVPAESGAIGLACIADDFFVAVRSVRDQVRMVLSDASAASEELLARQVLDALGLPVPDDDPDVPRPEGDLGLFADLGLEAGELAALCADVELYPDEVLAQVAARLGFGPQFDRAVDMAVR